MSHHCCLCRFEGFDAALENANADIMSGEQELRAASLANLALQRTAPAREQLRCGRATRSTGLLVDRP